MHVEIINKSNNPNPEYQTDQSAGMDLRSYLEKSENIAPGTLIVNIFFLNNFLY